MGSTPVRRTEQRRVLRQIFEASERPLSVNEILQIAKIELPRMGVATVYRNLRILEEEGLISAVHLPDEPPRYETTGRKHHHHFRCDDCDRVYDIASCTRRIESSLPDGYVVDRHEVTLYGQCPDCSRVG